MPLVPDGMVAMQPWHAYLLMLGLILAGVLWCFLLDDIGVRLEDDDER